MAVLQDHEEDHSPVGPPVHPVELLPWAESPIPVITPENSPLVSVIMPVYNGVATLERAVRSVQAQTVADWELLVVDDCSTDGTGGYSYDTTGQLTGETYSYQSNESHSYDANGNRTNTGYDTDPNNRLASDGVYDYEYDAEGNRTRRTRISDGSYTDYTWDYRNRLTSVTDRTSEGVATKVVNYTYDVQNRLVKESVDPDGAGEESATEQYFAYDGDQILLRFDGPTTNDLVDRYLWAPTVDLLLSDEKLTGPSTPGDIYWALGDNLNTVRDIARYNPGNDTTTIVNHRVFDAYGNLTSETNSAVDLIFSFTGRLFDEATGLQNNLNRWYDPTPGRWLCEDHIGFEGADPNLFRYVGNRPTMSTDPLGTYQVVEGDVPQEGWAVLLNRRNRTPMPKYQILKGISVIARGDSRFQTMPAGTATWSAGTARFGVARLQKNETIGISGAGPCVGVVVIPDSPDIPFKAIHFSALSSVAGGFQDAADATAKLPRTPLPSKPGVKYRAVICGAQKVPEKTDQDKETNRMTLNLFSDVVTYLRQYHYEIIGYVPAPNVQVDRDGNLYWTTPPGSDLSGYL